MAGGPRSPRTRAGGRGDLGERPVDRRPADAHDLGDGEHARVFPGGPGKTWSTEDFASRIDDLESRVFSELADETWVYPGHGERHDDRQGAPQLAGAKDRGW